MYSNKLGLWQTREEYRTRVCCKLLSDPFDKMYMTRGQRQWPRVTGKNGSRKVAFLLKKSVSYDQSPRYRRNCLPPRTTPYQNLVNLCLMATRFHVCPQFTNSLLNTCVGDYQVFFPYDWYVSLLLYVQPINKLTSQCEIRTLWTELTTNNARQWRGHNPFLLHTNLIRVGSLCIHHVRHWQVIYWHRLRFCHFCLCLNASYLVFSIVKFAKYDEEVVSWYWVNERF